MHLETGSFIQNKKQSKFKMSLCYNYTGFTPPAACSVSQPSTRGQRQAVVLYKVLGAVGCGGTLAPPPARRKRKSFWPSKDLVLLCNRSSCSRSGSFVETGGTASKLGLAKNWTWNCLRGVGGRPRVTVRQTEGQSDGQTGTHWWCCSGFH